MYNTRCKTLAAAALLCVSLLPVTVMAQNSHLDRSLWSWSASSTDTQDGGGLDALHDDDTSTFWHSNYHNESTHKCPHWVMIDRVNDKSPARGLSYVPRQGAQNNIVTEYRVYLSDKDFRNGSTVDLNSLGTADYSGTWSDDDFNEQTCDFKGKRTERYVLFVIDNTAKGTLAGTTGSSTAIAELYLLGNASSQMYNAVKIVPREGNVHRIAIDGSSLNISMNGRMIRMSNTGITIEYSIPEVKYFAFDSYEFPEGSYYDGTKQDLFHPGDPFMPVIAPESGMIPEGTVFDRISIGHPEGAEMAVNPESDGTATLTCGGRTLFAYTASQMETFYDPETRLFNISGFDASEKGIYEFSLPAGMLHEKGYVTTNTDLTATYQVDPSSRLESVSGDGSVLAFAVRDGAIRMSGITVGSTATLHAVNGALVASAPVSAFGTAAIGISGLQRGIYVLNVDGKSFKITI